MRQKNAEKDVQNEIVRRGRAYFTAFRSLCPYGFMKLFDVTVVRH